MLSKITISLTSVFLLIRLQHYAFGEIIWFSLFNFKIIWLEDCIVLILMRIIIWGTAISLDIIISIWNRIIIWRLEMKLIALKWVINILKYSMTTFDGLSWRILLSRNLSYKSFIFVTVLTLANWLLLIIRLFNLLQLCDI